MMMMMMIFLTILYYELFNVQHTAKTEMFTEVDLLARIVYKNKNQQQSSKQLQLVIHVLRLARRIKSLAIRGVIKEIGALFSVPPPVTASSSKPVDAASANNKSSAQQTSTANKKIQLPSTASIDFALVRIAAVAMLARQAHLTSVRCSAVLVDSIRHARFIPIMLSLLASVSRIDVYLRQLESDLVSVYQVLFTWKSLTMTVEWTARQAQPPLSATRSAGKRPATATAAAIIEEIAAFPLGTRRKIVATLHTLLSTAACPSSLTQWLDEHLGASASLHGLSEARMPLDDNSLAAFGGSAAASSDDPFGMGVQDSDDSDSEQNSTPLQPSASASSTSTKGSAEAAAAAVSKTSRAVTPAPGGAGPAAFSKRAGESSSTATTKRPRLTKALDDEDFGEAISADSVMTGVWR
ncbi:hypothetical protein, variant 1 [Capsaspora owczarzaki ATCC 30864]|uniref:Nucleolus and neural progenitor protein-like N-terminal domain-containing protein n=1 Tax=Capsaspora owczarzaki (strain ATCC 30864) TaxID=595528 RepID=A0A0D2X5Q8_CAPO3|nr:hypothetical protein, variant 1 [Capsaspora owczarzaki ATCC 30864]